MSSQGMPTSQAAHQNINNRDMQGISPLQVSRNAQRQGDAANAPPHGALGFGTEGMPTISHIGHGMSFALPSVTSESVAALAAQATMLAAQLREYEARAALAALHVLPSSSQQAECQPNNAAYPASQQYSSAIAQESRACQLPQNTFPMALAHRGQVDQAGRSSGGFPSWQGTAKAVLCPAVIGSAFCSGPGGGAPGVNMEFETAEMKMGKQSLDIRKKNDRDKKRRK